MNQQQVEDKGPSSGLTLLVFRVLEVTQVTHVCQAFILASAEMLHNNDTYYSD